MKIRVIKGLFETYTSCMLDNNGTFVPKTTSNTESKTELKPCIPLIKLDEFIEPYNTYERVLMQTLYATNEYYKRRENDRGEREKHIRENREREMREREKWEDETGWHGMESNNVKDKREKLEQNRDNSLKSSIIRNANNEKFIKSRDQRQLRFTSGTNILYDDKKPLNTIDLFGGGISGHTAEIGVMLRLFTNVPNESIEILQQLTAFVALIWMYDYMHHSLREILLGSTIFYNRTEAIKTYIDENVTYLYSPIGKQTYDAIITKVKGIIDTVLNIRPADIDGIPVEPLKPMIKFLLSSPSSTEAVAPYILQKLKGCKNAVDTFKTDIQRNHPHIYERISWPTDEMCNTNKHVIQSRKDYNTIIALQEFTATATGGMRHRKRHITRRIHRSKKQRRHHRS